MNRWSKELQILSLFRKTINGWDVRFDLFIKPRAGWFIIWPLYYYGYADAVNKEFEDIGRVMRKLDIVCLPIIGLTFYMLHKERHEIDKQVDWKKYKEKNNNE